MNIRYLRTTLVFCSTSRWLGIQAAKCCHMQMSPTRSLVLVFRYNETKYAEMVRGLGALSAGESARPKGVDAYYEPTSQSVGLVLHYFISNLTLAVRQRIDQICAALHVDVVDPERATDAERSLLERIAASPARVFNETNVSMSLWTLRQQKGFGVPAAPRGKGTSIGAASGGPNGRPTQPGGMPRAASPGAGARERNAPPIARPHAAIASHASTMSPLGTPSSCVDDEYSRATRSVQALGRGTPPPEAYAQASAPRIGEYGPSASPTRVAASPLATIDDCDTEQYRLETVAPLGFDVRYLRNGRWVPARLRALSIKGAYMVTGALQRVGDRIHVAVAVGDYSALMRAKVFHVTNSSDVVTTGTAGFAVRFELDDTSAAQLGDLLDYAARCELEIDPPPARCALRLPVAWPVTVRVKGRAMAAEALDVSEAGLFVQSTATLPIGTDVDFTIELDDGGAPVSGRGRVVRALTDPDASSRGMRPGYGLAITAMTNVETPRWTAFLERVLRRTQKRVLVAASHARAEAIARTLTAAGYCVVMGTDNAALMQVTDADGRLPDVAIIDPSVGASSEKWIHSALGARNVPRIASQGDVTTARPQVDRALQVN